MVLKAVVENLDDVDASLHDEYTEKDGKFYLDLDDSIKVHTAVTPLAGSLTSLKADKAKLRRDLDAANARLEGIPEDFDAEKYAEIKAEYERLKADPNYKGGGADTQQLKEQYESRIRNLEAKHATEIAALQTQAGNLENELGGIIVGDGLTQALVDAGVAKQYLKATRAMLQGSVRVVVDEDTGRRRAVVETDMGEVGVKDFVDTWAKSDEGKVFVTPATGGGAGGSDARSRGDNPWTAEKWNVTEQGRIYTEKGKEVAEQMAKRAGTTIGGGKPPARSAAA